jgi:hypothetical protein
MARLYRLTILFAILFAVFFILPAFLSNPLGLYPLMEVADAFDLLTPLVLIPVYWLLLELRPETPPSRGENLAFLVLAALWVEGQGMHLAANSIGHLLKTMMGTDAYTLTDFYDEMLSHYLWHFGVIALSALLLYRQWRHPFAQDSPSVGGGTLALGIIASVVYGLAFFLIATEGRTVPMSFPFAILSTLFGLIWGRSSFRKQPLLLFLTVGYLVAVLFLAGWGIYGRGTWPEPKKVLDSWMA